MTCPPENKLIFYQSYFSKTCHFSLCPNQTYMIYFFSSFPRCDWCRCLGSLKNRLQDFCAKNLLGTTQVRGRFSKIGQREKLKYDATSTRVLLTCQENVRAGVSLQNCPVLRQSKWDSVAYHNLQPDMGGRDLD